MSFLKPSIQRGSRYSPTPSKTKSSFRVKFVVTTLASMKREALFMKCVRVSVWTEPLKYANLSKQLCLFSR
jgi:hypothetical protein